MIEACNFGKLLEITQKKIIGYRAIFKKKKTEKKCITTGRCMNITMLYMHMSASTTTCP